jgi:hypothetical protein
VELSLVVSCRVVTDAAVWCPVREVVLRGGGSEGWGRAAIEVLDVMSIGWC